MGNGRLVVPIGAGASYDRADSTRTEVELDYGPRWSISYLKQPTTFELVINLKTAKTLGLTIPPSLLITLRARSTTL